MKIQFECASCEKSDSATAAVISSAIEALATGNKLKFNPASVTDCMAMLLFSLIESYSNGNELLGRIVDALGNKDDEVVKSLGILNRQALNAVLNILKKQRKAVMREQEKRIQETRSNSSSTDMEPT